MKMTFRWYGDSDPVTLDQIRQIPGMKGIVSAIYDVPVGEVWSYEKIKALKDKIEAKGLEFTTIESVPVHEDIKMGKPSRDRLIDNYCETLNNLGKCGIKVVCYNFMPVFDWTRSELDHVNKDGSTSLVYYQDQIDKWDLKNDELTLPGWDASYTKDQLKGILEEYEAIDDEKLWENLGYFLKKIIPVAEINDIKMAIHPDDPPWGIFGLPRIIKDYDSYKRLAETVPSTYNGITLCTGSLGPNAANDLVKLIHDFSDRIHFGHVRNILRVDGCSFEETAHMSEYGSIDMYEIMKAFYDIKFEGPIRPDHGRMVWGETGKPGYGLYDRALGSCYLNGLWEAIDKATK